MTHPQNLKPADRYRVRPLLRNWVEHPEACDGTVRITNRLFPECEYLGGVGMSDYRRFHLRYYLPVRPMIERHTRGIDRVFLLINGLAEFKWFTLYDQIGSFLARDGAAAVLLPLPNHLNRHPLYRRNAGDIDVEPNVQEAMRDLANKPGELMSFFEQYLREVEILVKHIRNDCRQGGEGECGFFELFARNPRISVIGYSLGGLFALSLRLIDANLHSCVLLNSGASLGDIKLPPDMIAPSAWQEIVRNLADNWRRRLSHGDHGLLFERVFLGDDRQRLQESLKEHASRIMVIVGGADAVVPAGGAARLEQEGFGLFVQKIPGLGHFLGVDRHWDKWLEVALQGIVSFECDSDRWTAREIVTTLASANNRIPLIVGGRVSLRKIDDRQQRKAMERLVQVALALYPSEAALVADIERASREQRAVIAAVMPYHLQSRVVARGGFFGQIIKDDCEWQALVALRERVDRIFGGDLKLFRSQLAAASEVDECRSILRNALATSSIVRLAIEHRLRGPLVDHDGALVSRSSDVDELLETSRHSYADDSKILAALLRTAEKQAAVIEELRSFRDLLSLRGSIDGAPTFEDIQEVLAKGAGVFGDSHYHLMNAVWEEVFDRGRLLVDAAAS